jgi:hypothetical protein
VMVIGLGVIQLRTIWVFIEILLFAHYQPYSAGRHGANVLLFLGRMTHDHPRQKQDNVYRAYKECLYGWSTR